MTKVEKTLQQKIDGMTTQVSKERMDEIAIEFPHLPEIKDLTAPRNEYMLRLPRSLERWVVDTMMKDPRDAAMLSTMANILMTTLPLAALLFVYPSHLLGVAIVAFNLITWMERYILMLHYAEHRGIFVNKYWMGNKILPWILAPFFGIPPGMYPLHHVVMHHIENNVFNEDLSSTEPYQRDKFTHFLHYWAKYFASLYGLPLYAIAKGRYALAAQSMLGTGWLVVTLYLGMVHTDNAIATGYVVLAPFLIASFALMFGNFSQHIFVHPNIATIPQKLKSYEFNCYLSMQLINSFENQKTFNDGYHVTHHINSQCHWSDMPAHFLTNLEKFRDCDAFVFHSCFFNDVGIAVFTHNWQWLYDHYVHLTKEKKTLKEMTKEFKLRLKPINRSNRAVSVDEKGKIKAQ